MGAYSIRPHGIAAALLRMAVSVLPFIVGATTAPQAEHQAWRWAWAATELQAERGFWALGEAIVDAAMVRYPAAFESTVGVE
ncbi:MAG: hypothetical protein ACJ8CR_20670 [Roseiflexaceae bacterium]